MPFQIHYDNVVLDTLHNYFPALLYEPEAFQTLPEVFAYSRVQMQRHFDLFAAARAAYRPVRAPLVEQNPRDMVNAVYNLINSLQAPMGNFTNIMPAIPIMNFQIPPAFENPVVVRATEEQIAVATTLEILTEGSEVCSICQDSIAVNSEIRTINACDHQFHTGCIDTWFQQNVRCPVCRHDIRE
jgi:hypothetical protein